jgi:hypothetical protein
MFIQDAYGADAPLVAQPGDLPDENFELVMNLKTAPLAQSGRHARPGRQPSAKFSRA